MKLLIFLLLFSTARAQSVHNIFIARPVVEHADTIIYHTKGQTFAIYKYKDGSAWVQDKNSLEYKNKRKYRKWKRKNVKM